LEEEEEEVVGRVAVDFLGEAGLDFSVEDIFFCRATGFGQRV